MRGILLLLVLTIMSLSHLCADMPGATTYGQQYRQNGRIVNAPNYSNPVPTYYHGNVIYRGPGAPYRDRLTGKIDYSTSYTAYPYHYNNVEYNWERQRISNLNNNPQANYQPQNNMSSYQRYYQRNNPSYQNNNNQPYYNQNNPANNPSPGYNTANQPYNPNSQPNIPR